MTFDEDKIYASCGNPGGFLALPVGWVYIQHGDKYESVANADVVDGHLLNYIFSHWTDISLVVFEYPKGKKILYDTRN